LAADAPAERYGEGSEETEWPSDFVLYDVPDLLEDIAAWGADTPLGEAAAARRTRLLEQLEPYA